MISRCWKKADYPFLVERRGGGYESGIAFKGLITLKGIGPEGWAKGVSQLLQEI